MQHIGREEEPFAPAGMGIEKPFIMCRLSGIRCWLRHRQNDYFPVRGQTKGRAVNPLFFPPPPQTLPAFHGPVGEPILPDDYPNLFGWVPRERVSSKQA